MPYCDSCELNANCIFIAEHEFCFDSAVPLSRRSTAPTEADPRLCRHALHADARAGWAWAGGIRRLLSVCLRFAICYSLLIYRSDFGEEFLIKEDDPCTCFLEGKIVVALFIVSAFSHALGTAYYLKMAAILPDFLSSAVNYARLGTIQSVDQEGVSNLCRFR
jgi:hypothetical protein